MNTATILPVVTASLVLLGTFLLGMGKQNLYLPLVMAPVVITSVYFTDYKGWIRLHRNVANWAALAAAVFAFARFFQVTSGSRLYPVSDLLVYLEIILLLQVKTVRIYAHLTLLSMLQVVVAAALDVNFWCGLVILLYLAVAIFEAFLLYAERETRRFAALDGATADGPPVWTNRLAGDRSLAHVSRQWLRGMLRQGSLLIALTLGLTVVMFFLAPRRGTPSSGGLGRQISVVGFSEDVQLGELDSVVEDAEIVMNVQFIDPATKESFQTFPAPLLRGSVVTTYNTYLRQWRQADWKPGTGVGGLNTDALRNTELSNTVRQHIVLEPLRQFIVFTVAPPVSIDDQVLYDAEQLRLYRTRQGRMTLDIHTLGFNGRRQSQIVPQTEVRAAASPVYDPIVAPRLVPRLLEYLDLCKAIPVASGGKNPFPELTAITLDVMNEAGVPRLEDAAEGEPLFDPFLAARALENFLRFEGGFTYALEPRRVRRDIDPIEDFVANNRRGHCEYFASAMVMMLRTLNIPARMAIGFRAEEWNSIGKFYVVRQLHAHTWVEAFLKPEDMRRHGLSVKQNPLTTVDTEDEDSVTLGGWLLLDPTAVASVDTNRYTSGWFGGFRELGDYIQSGWTYWVLGMDGQRQREFVFQPLARALRAPAALVSGDEPLRFRFRRLYKSIRQTLAEWTGGHWFSWRGGLVAMAFSLIFLAIFATLRAAWRWAFRWAISLRGGRTGAKSSRIAFHERFLRTLARHGFRRRVGQTPLEMAGVVGDFLARSTRQTELAAIPARIVEAFYQVRFGGRPLDNRQAAAVEKALIDLETALARRPRERSAKH